MSSFFFFSSRRRHTRCSRDWSSDVCSSDLPGVVLAGSGLQALLAVWPHALPRTPEIALDAQVLAFSLGLAVVTGVAFGLLPAWRASAPGIEQSLREDAPGATGGRRRLQGTLVAGGGGPAPPPVLGRA